MTSPISTRSLLKLECKQSSWMFALSALAQFLAGPVYYLLAVTPSSYMEPVAIISRHCSFYDDNYFLIQLLGMLLIIGFSIFSYRYLFSKRMVDLYHSVPITRTRLFWTKYLHGFLVWLLPFIISTFCVLLLSFLRLHRYLTLEYAGMLLRSWFGSVLLILFCFFIFYHLFLVAAYLSGNILNLLTNILVIGISIAATYALLLSCAECFWDTFCYTPTNSLVDTILSLSPLITPFYFYFYVEDFGVFNILTEHPLLLLTSFLFSLLLLYLSWILCNKRPSELAERGTQNKLYKIPARIMATFMASVALSLFFSEIVSTGFKLFWGIFGAILGAVLCYGALNSIYHTTIKSFFRNLSQMIGITVVGILTITVFQTDLFGYDTYLPDKEDIAGIAIYLSSFSDNTSDINITSDKDWIYSREEQQVRQEILLSDKDICYDFLDLVIHKHTGGDRRTFYAKIQLENGRTYMRQYYIDYTDYMALAPFIESEEYKYTNYKIGTGFMGDPNQLEVNLRDAQVTFKLTGSSIRQFMDAYRTDFAKHYTLEEMSSYLYNVSVELEYTNKEGEYFYCYQSIPEYYKNTMEYLQGLYPEQIPYITSPKQLANITPYISLSNMQEYGSVRSYYGMEGVPKTPLPQATSSGEIVVIEENGFEAEATVQYAASMKETEIIITDEEQIEMLFPLLYFGNYSSSFDRREYIYFGEVQTKEGYYVSCYVKPNTVPESIIQMMEESMTLSED